MSRREPGTQKTWTKSSDTLWPWRAKALYYDESAHDRLSLLERIWTQSGNFAALQDALFILRQEQVACRWATDAAAAWRASNGAFERWSRRYHKDLLDVVRLQEFENARNSDDGPGLSRPEATRFVFESLRATIAATTPSAVFKLPTILRERESRRFGRYYLGAGSYQWREKHFGRQPIDCELIWKWRHRATLRGNSRMADAERADLRYVHERAQKGEDSARETLMLYDRIKNGDS